MKEILEKICDAFLYVLVFVIFVLILGLIMSPFFVPIIIYNLTSSSMFAWIVFGTCIIISISTIVIIIRTVNKSNERERERQINDRYHIVKDEGYYL